MSYTVKVNSKLIQLAIGAIKKVRPKLIRSDFFY